jgi:hypothetical protein
VSYSSYGDEARHCGSIQVQDNLCQNTLAVCQPHFHLFILFLSLALCICTYVSRCICVYVCVCVEVREVSLARSFSPLAHSGANSDTHTHTQSLSFFLSRSLALSLFHSLFMRALVWLCRAPILFWCLTFVVLLSAAASLFHSWCCYGLPVSSALATFRALIFSLFCFSCWQISTKSNPHGWRRVLNCWPLKNDQNINFGGQRLLKEYSMIPGHII